MDDVDFDIQIKKVKNKEGNKDIKNNNEDLFDFNFDKEFGEMQSKNTDKNIIVSDNLNHSDTNKKIDNEEFDLFNFNNELNTKNGNSIDIFSNFIDSKTDKIDNINAQFDFETNLTSINLNKIDQNDVKTSDKD